MTNLFNICPPLDSFAIKKSTLGCDKNLSRIQVGFDSRIPSDSCQQYQLSLNWDEKLIIDFSTENGNKSMTRSLSIFSDSKTAESITEAIYIALKTVVNESSCGVTRQ